MPKSILHQLVSTLGPSPKFIPTLGTFSHSSIINLKCKIPTLFLDLQRNTHFGLCFWLSKTRRNISGFISCLNLHSCSSWSNPPWTKCGVDFWEPPLHRVLGLRAHSNSLRVRWVTLARLVTERACQMSLIKISVRFVRISKKKFSQKKILSLGDLSSQVNSRFPVLTLSQVWILGVTYYIRFPRSGGGFDDDRDDSSAWYVIKCPLEILAWHLNHLWQFGTGLRPLHHTIFPISTFCQPWPWWQLKYDLSYVDHLSTIKMLIWNG